MSAENVSLIKAIYHAFGTGDVPAVVAAMSPDIEWYEAENFPYADGNPYRGADGILGGVFARIASEWDGFHVEPEQFLDAGDTVIMLGRYAGTCRATGRTMSPQAAHIWTIAGGKVVRFQQLVDTLAVARAMGAA
jgi:ketosteroid isomerase-like protein